MKRSDKFEYMWPALICFIRINSLFGEKYGFENLYIRILRLCFYFLLLLLFTVLSLVTFFHFIIIGSYFQSIWIYALWIIIYIYVLFVTWLKLKLKLYQSERKVTMFCLLLWAVSFVWKCSFLFIYLFFKYYVFC